MFKVERMVVAAKEEKEVCSEYKEYGGGVWWNYGRGLELKVRLGLTLNPNTLPILYVEWQHKRGRGKPIYWVNPNKQTDLL